MAVKRPRRPTRHPLTNARAKGRSGRRRAAPVAIQEVESLRAELQRLAHSAPARWNADPDDVRKSVLKLVLTLVEFIRQLLERQAIRRMETNTLTAEEVEAVGLALMRLEETIRDLAGQFGLRPEELNLDLGPIGKLV
jgi:regulator of sirC expression with transglutaminase-like and TPR domain